MTPDQARLVVLERRITSDVPGFAVKFKDKSRSQRFLGAVMFFNRQYMKSYISTFYPNVYWPTEDDYTKNPRASFDTLAHEYVHLVDGRRHRFWFGFSYLLPHLIALLSLGAIAAAFHSLWWLLFLVALVAAAPLPSPWRAHWEMRGYTMTMAVHAWRTGKVAPELTGWIAEQFTGWSYYRMWPFEKSVRNRLFKAISRIHSGDVLLTSPVFKQVKSIIDMKDDVVVSEARRIEHEKRVAEKLKGED